MAFLVIALLLGIATISSKAKSKPMYVRATLMILATVMTCNYIGTFSKTIRCETAWVSHLLLFVDQLLFDFLKINSISV